jgi:metallo-beta-lactamase class B
MLKSLSGKTIVAGIFLLISLSTAAQKVKEPRVTNTAWATPYQPFRIAGNLYYVGTYDLAAYLITTNQGNILINTGLAASAKGIKKNIELLGFKLSDTKILLTTQAHYDHLGAMATIKKRTGAMLMINEADSAVAADGGSSDYALGGHGSTFKPIKPDKILHNGDTIRLGHMQLIMLHHPGHTKGSCSFLFTVNDEQQLYKVLIANMPTIVTEKNFKEVTDYPAIAKDYAYTLQTMKTLSFDIWLASHASQFNLHGKHQPGDSYNPRAFIDKAGYDTAIDDLQKEYNEHLNKQ